jgi:hypothetical protein
MGHKEEWSRDLELIEQSGASLGAGLSDVELAAAEELCGSRFPPDLRGFLSTALPVGKSFPNWRVLDDGALEYRLAWPFDGIRFDIENNDFWRTEWGQRPDDLNSAIELARQAVGAAPRLIPIYSHRFLPAEPLESGNPVFSIYQTDIIYYGRDLHTYFAHEFGGVEYAESITPAPRHVRFWSDLTS